MKNALLRLGFVFVVAGYVATACGAQAAGAGLAHHLLDLGDASSGLAVVLGAGDAALVRPLTRMGST